MKRPLQPVPALSTEEKKRERRFTRRITALALVGGLFGSCLNLTMRAMGRPPPPAGSPPAIAYVPPTPNLVDPPPANPTPKPPRLAGK
jgi:hypothetical protein